MHLFSLILLIPSLFLLFLVYASLSCYMLCLVVSSVCFFVTPWTVACQALLPMGIFQARILEWVVILQGHLPNLGTQPRSSALQADSLSTKPPGKPMNTGRGRLSLLQGIFPTQESNSDLLHCRRILYQLSYQGNPSCYIAVICNFQTERLKLYYLFL